MKKETIVANTMREFKEGKLRSSSGDKVSDRDQAIAIALSKSGQSKYAKGGYVVQYDPEKKKTITRTKKEADDFVEVLKKNGHTLIEIFKVGEESKTKVPASKSDVNDIEDAIIGAKTLLKFASASEKKEIETFIKGLEILKKMSGEPKTPKTEKMKTMSLSKDRDYVKEAKEYFIDAGFIDELNTDERFYVNELIKGISTPFRSNTEIEANKYFIENEMADQLTKDKQFYVVKLIENSKKKSKNPESKSTMSYTKKEIIDFVDRLSYFKLDPNGDEQTIIYNTRKHGNVGSQTAGQKDLDAAERIKKEVESKFPGVKVEYGPSDEYVDLGIMLPNTKSESKNSKSKYTLDEAKKFFIEAGKIDEVSPDTERLIRALIDQDKSPIRTEDELYAEKSLLPNITKWGDDWKYHITNLISLSKKKKGEFPKTNERYTYALTSRPFDIGTYPKENFVRFVYEEQDDYKFGLLEYSAPIPVSDLLHYSLAPVSELNQYNEKLFDYFDGNIGQAFIKKTPGNIPYVKVDLYDDPNEEAIETIDLSGQEFLSKIKSGDYKILENQSKIKDTDGENHLNKNQNLQSIKKQIIDFVEKNSWFQLDDDSDDFMLFATRENGNVGSESPGSKDILEAKRLKQEIEKKFKDSVKIELEVVDEWVHINIDILRNKFSKGGSIRKMGLYDSVLYNDKQYSISEKDGVKGLKNLSRGAWGSDYPFIPLNEVDMNEVTDMYGNKVEISNKFESGGSISKNYEIVEGFDPYKNIPLYRVTDRDEYVGEWHSNRSDAEKELSGFGTKFNDGGLPESHRFYVRSNFGHWSVTDSINNIMIVGYSSKEDAYKTANGLNQIRDAYQLEKTINLLQTQQGYGHFLNKYADGGDVRGMDWYQMWQPKRNKVIKVGDIVVHQHSKQPYKIIELLDDQYTVAKLDGNKEIEWKTFYEDFEDHKMFMPQQFAGGGTTLNQYIWNNHDLMIKGRYKVTGAVEAEVVIAGWEVGGDSGKDEYLSMYQPSMEQNQEIKTLNVKRAYLRKMSNGLEVPATTGTGKKVKIQRIGGIYFKTDGQPY